MLFWMTQIWQGLIREAKRLQHFYITQAMQHAGMYLLNFKLLLRLGKSGGNKVQEKATSCARTSTWRTTSGWIWIRR